MFGVGVDGDVTGFVAAAPDPNLQLVHPLEVPLDRTLGAIHLDLVATRGPHDHPGRLNGAHRTGTLRIGTEPDQRRRVVLVFHRAHLAALDHIEVRPRTHRQLRPLGVDGAGQRGELGDRAHHVLAQVTGVAEQIGQHPSPPIPG